ncbi:uncharacterized protein LOC135397893 [Ornithodoros turicata]|uniref:uncharacterized protein LOC135397893 n=1 Tax=Ornithodoros turicata TaxID=34597 RepID=UPI0031386312
MATVTRFEGIEEPESLESTTTASFKFTEERTKKFIMKRHELKDLFNAKRNSGRQGWERIIRELNMVGATPEQCRKKWLNLQQTYKKLKDPPTGAGSEDGELSWPYYSLLDSIMSGRAIITPPCLVSSAGVASPVPQAAATESDSSNNTSPEASEERRPVKRRRCVFDMEAGLLEEMQKQTEIMGKFFNLLSDKLMQH